MIKVPTTKRELAATLKRERAVQPLPPMVTVITGGGNNSGGEPGTPGESPQFRMSGNILQYRFATQAPTVWTDLYTFEPLTYEHTQALPSDVWNIQHNLGGRSVTVLTLDAAGEQIIGQIDTLMSTDNLLVIRFSEALAGTAYIKL